MLRALDDLVHQGKVRYMPAATMKPGGCLKLCGSAKPGTCTALNAFSRSTTWREGYRQDIIPVCELKNLGVVTYSPLANGFLSGKYEPGDER